MGRLFALSSLAASSGPAAATSSPYAETLDAYSLRLRANPHRVKDGHGAWRGSAEASSCPEDSLRLQRLLVERRRRPEILRPLAAAKLRFREPDGPGGARRRKR